VTNHDVKAVEYYVKHKLAEIELGDKAEFVHFGLTSQDINNTAIPLTLKEALNNVMIPQYEKIVSQIREMAVRYAGIPMLARTHGQPATPTNLGKEMMVFVERLEKQFQKLKDYKFE
jgi:adenylosuccinate lyase